MQQFCGESFTIGILQQKVEVRHFPVCLLVLVHFPRCMLMIYMVFSTSLCVFGVGGLQLCVRVHATHAWVSVRVRRRPWETFLRCPLNVAVGIASLTGTLLD